MIAFASFDREVAGTVVVPTHSPADAILPVAVRGFAAANATIATLKNNIELACQTRDTSTFIRLTDEIDIGVFYNNNHSEAQSRKHYMTVLDVLKMIRFAISVLHPAIVGNNNVFNRAWELGVYSDLRIIKKYKMIARDSDFGEMLARLRRVRTHARQKLFEAEAVAYHLNRLIDNSSERLFRNAHEVVAASSAVDRCRQTMSAMVSTPAPKRRRVASVDVAASHADSPDAHDVMTVHAPISNSLLNPGDDQQYTQTTELPIPANLDFEPFHRRHSVSSLEDDLQLDRFDRQELNEMSPLTEASDDITDTTISAPHSPAPWVAANDSGVEDLYTSTSPPSLSARAATNRKRPAPIEEINDIYQRLNQLEENIQRNRQSFLLLGDDVRLALRAMGDQIVNMQQVMATSQLMTKSGTSSY